MRAETGFKRAWFPCLAALAAACSVQSLAAETGSAERRRIWTANMALEAGDPDRAAPRFATAVPFR